MGALFKTLKGILSSAGASDAGKVPLLGSDGKLHSSFLEPAVPTQVVQIQRGTAAVAASGAKTASKTVTFASPFATTPTVVLICGNANTAGVVPKAMATSVGTGGFTVSLSTLTGGSSADGFSGSNIDASINVHWIAVG